MRGAYLQAILVCALLVWVPSAHAAINKNLVGHWKGVSGKHISLQLRRNKTYIYRYRMLTFTGKWSVRGNTITLNYSVLGVKRKKRVQYRLKRQFMTLRSHEHATVTMRKIF